MSYYDKTFPILRYVLVFWNGIRVRFLKLYFRLSENLREKLLQDRQKYAIIKTRTCDAYEFLRCHPFKCSQLKRANA